MQPSTVDAMYNLIAQIKNTLPFERIDASFCSDSCTGCSLKLLEFIGIEVDNWEYKLKQGITPNFKDLNKLAKMAKKIHVVLIKNQLI